MSRKTENNYYLTNTNSNEKESTLDGLDINGTAFFGQGVDGEQLKKFKSITQPGQAANRYFINSLDSFAPKEARMYDQTSSDEKIIWTPKKKFALPELDMDIINEGLPSTDKWNDQHEDEMLTGDISQEFIKQVKEDLHVDCLANEKS